jgi:hypothetical protein
MLLLLIVAGCSPRFVAPSASNVEILTQPGFMWVIPGSPTLPNGSLGREENLLYILVTCPGLEYTEHGGGTEYERTSTRYLSDWRTPSGRISVEVTWDRRADTILAGGQKLQRTKGCAVVIIRNKSGQLSVRQVPGPGPAATPQQALESIKQQLPDDKLIGSLKLVSKD